VVDLADRRVLAHQHPVAVTQVGDVAQHHDAAVDVGALEQWERVHEDLGLAALQLHHHGHT
jgi:hypothetical protein